MSCKVCIDAGKSEEVYTSHRVKDKAGMVICRTLLNQKCLNCGKFGHTVKYCSNVQSLVSECRKYRDSGVREDGATWEYFDANKKEKFCAVCRDAGREHTNHNLMEDGIIVCENLKTIQCRKCKEYGHTPKYCRAKFCPVCRDAEREYTDHNLMEDGEVVCEYLKNTKCNNCDEYGHTQKYCKEPRRQMPLTRLSDIIAVNLFALRKTPDKTPDKPPKKEKYIRIL